MSWGIRCGGLWRMVLVLMAFMKGVVLIAFTRCIAMQCRLVADYR